MANLLKKDNSKKDKKVKKQKDPKLNVYKKTAAKNIAKQTFKLVGIAILALFVLYIIFAAMIIRVVPTGNNIGNILVKNSSYYGGLIPKDEIVLINNEGEVENSPINNLKMAMPFINQNTSLVQVKAGPVGKFKWNEPGIVSINGDVIKDGLMRPFDDENSQYEKKYLEGEYVALCIKGDCEPGTLKIFGEKDVMGVPVGETDVKESIQEANKDIKNQNFFPSNDNNSDEVSQSDENDE